MMRLVTSRFDVEKAKGWKHSRSLPLPEARGTKETCGVGVATTLAGLPVSSSRHAWPLGCAEVASEQWNKYVVPVDTCSPPPFDHQTSDTRPLHPLSGNNAIAWYAKASVSRRRHLAHLKH